MLDERFIVLVALLSFAGGARYIWSTFRGQTQPNRVTWILLSLFTAIVLVAEIDAGVGWPIIGIAAPLFNTSMIVLVSFVNPKAYWKTERQDYAFAGIALLGLVLWQLSNNPSLAIGFSIVADLLAAMPTFIKAYRKPLSEKGTSFAIWTVSSIILVMLVENSGLHMLPFQFI